MKKTNNHKDKSDVGEKSKDIDPNKMTSDLAKALHKAARRCKLPS